MGQPKLVNKDDEFDSVFADELEPGHTLMQGQYTIEEFLNAGGFGITYRARDSLDRPVVIKECFPGSFCRRTTTSVQARSRAHQKELSSIVRLFVQEARSLARLDHPNIVGVHQVFEENNTAYMALDYVEGRDLLDMIEEPTDILEPAQVEQILRKLLDAVGFIHGQGVLHRDISPDNVLLQPNFEPILIDFGAAREEASKQSRVLSAMRVVKDGYSPQEFYITGSEQGPFSDLYALGATFYHLMTGELPANSQARLAAVATGEPDPYTRVIDRMPGYSENFLKGIDQSLEILPKDRIESAESWLELLDGKANIAPAGGSSKAKKAATSSANAETAVATKKKSPMKGLLLGGAAVLVPLVGILVVTQTGSSNGAVEAPILASTPAVEQPAADIAQSAQSSALGLTPPADGAASATTPSDQSAALGIAPTEEPVTDINDVFWATTNTGTAQAETATTDLTSPDVVAPAIESLTPPAAPVVPANVSSERFVSVPYTPATTPVPTAEIPDDRFVSESYTVPLTQNPISVSLRPSGRTEIDLAIANVVVPETVEPVVVPEVAVEPTAVIEASEAAIDEVANPALAWMNITPTAPGTSSVIAPAATPEIAIETYNLPQVLTGWTIKLPANLTEGESTVFSINGLDIVNLNSIDTVLRENFAAPDGVETEITVLTGTDRDTADFVTVAAPVIQRTLFLNGFAFETQSLNGEWVTQVVSAPAQLGLDLQPGDTIVGDLASGTPFNTRTSLPDLLLQAIEQDRSVLTLAVRRDGQTATISFPTPR